jgi:hypothetical protein
MHDSATGWSKYGWSTNPYSRRDQVRRTHRYNLPHARIVAMIECEDHFDALRVEHMCFLAVDALQPTEHVGERFLGLDPLHVFNLVVSSVGIAVSWDELDRRIEHGWRAYATWDPPKHFLTSRQVADHLNCTTERLACFVRAGAVQPTRVEDQSAYYKWRWTEDAVQRAAYLLSCGRSWRRP